MLLSFSLSNTCGSFYKSGSLIFSPTKNTLFSPTGNKFCMIDLDNNLSTSINIQTRSDIDKFAISPDSKMLIAVDINGYASVINLYSENIVNRFNFKSKVNDIKFSPDGNHFAICTDSQIKIFEKPPNLKTIEPFILHRKYQGTHSSKTQRIEWSPDSRFILSTGKDLTVVMYSANHIKNYIPFVFAGNKALIVKMWFSKDMEYVYTLGKDGSMCIWKWVEDFISNEYKNLKDFEMKKKKIIKLDNDKSIVANEEKTNEKEGIFEEKALNGRFVLEKRELFQGHSKISQAEWHPLNSLLIIAFRNGTFSLSRIENSTITLLQTFALTQNKINTLSFNKNGNWIVFGIEKIGQVIVWEWRSQSYILNQQGIFNEILCIDISPDGQKLVSGGVDGKVKLWDARSFFCFATFSEHSSKVNAVKFKDGKTVVSCSSDGTVRAFDTYRYRNFRTMTPDVPNQFTCLDIDSSGELICAGGFDPFNIYLFSLQTGHLLEALSGHEGVVSDVRFSPKDGVLASCSWDKSIRVWDVFSRKREAEILEHNSEVLALDFRADGQEISSTTLKGEIYLWDAKIYQVKGYIDCRRDVAPGREDSMVFSAKNSPNKYYTTICYSADGEFLLAGGISKYLNIYDIKHRVLTKKYQLTKNRNLDGVLDKLNSKNIKEGINLNEIDYFSGSDYEDRKDNVLPGAKKNDFSKRIQKARMEIRKVKFSSCGRFWAVATTEGIQIYSLDKYKYFTPFELNENVSIEKYEDFLFKNDFKNALFISLNLNQKELIERVYFAIGKNEISFICKNLPVIYLKNFLSFLAKVIENDINFELHLIWVKEIIEKYAK